MVGCPENSFFLPQQLPQICRWHLISIISQTGLLKDFRSYISCRLYVDVLQYLVRHASRSPPSRSACCTSHTISGESLLFHSGPTTTLPTFRPFSLSSTQVSRSLVSLHSNPTSMEPRDFFLEHKTNHVTPLPCHDCGLLREMENAELFQPKSIYRRIYLISR